MGMFTPGDKMNENNIQILCEYCKGITYNDLLGNCIACGAGREEKNMPEPEPKPHESLRWGVDYGVESGSYFSMVCSSAAFATTGAPFAMPHTIRPEPMPPSEATK